MNAFPFVNSKNIRTHLEKIGYEFSPIEAAWLIYQSRNHTLAEKHAAWRELAEEYPDVAFDAKYTEYVDAPYERLSDYLRLYIDTEEKLLREFSKNDGSFVYCVDPLDENSFMGGYMDELFTRAFSDYETCVEALKEWYQKASAQYKESTERAKYKIYCRPLDNAPVRLSSVTVRDDGEVLSLTDPEGGNETEDFSPHHLFDFMWFSFPVPFHKGDILWDPVRGKSGFCRGPLVMVDITPEHYARTQKSGCDDTDMNVWGYFQSNDGTVYREATSNYMDFEYYPPEKLTGKRRVLVALSNLVKEKINVELFSAAYPHILAEEAAKVTKPQTFTDEDLRLAGLEINESE